MKNIMIKTAVATAVIAATTASTFAAGHAKANAPTLYGRLNVAALCADNGTDDACAITNNGSRFGIKASTEVSEGLSAFAKYEFATDLDNGDTSAATRLGFVGLKGGFGEVSLGTRWSPLYNHTISPIDAPNAFGATSASYGYQTDFRNSDTINYKNKFGAASVGIQVQMSHEDLSEDINEVTLGASFKVGSATIGLGFQDNKAADDTITAIHARTKFGPVGIGGTFSTSDAQDSILVALNYGMGGGKSINLAYGQDDVDGSDATPNSIGIEYLHNLGSGVKWYAGFETEDADLGGDDVQQYGVGMRYDF